MDVLLRNNALELARLLHDHNGGDVVVMDMMPLDFWTDYFVIATVTSNTHMSGLERHIKNFLLEKDLKIIYRTRRPGSKPGRSYRDNESPALGPEEWCLLDLGGIVIHLMTANSRSFYELERLWSAAPLIFQGNLITTDAYSSKSS